MKSNFSIDHHVQTSILSLLLQEGPQVFSSIKPDDIENSLFMYHMNKLISRGIVEKKDGNFTLTSEGARWLNKTGLKANPIEEPRCLIQFLVISNDRVLLSERLDHLAEHMNRYLLPGGLHKFGTTRQESAVQLADKLKLQFTDKPIAKIETIVKDENHHSIADIYLATAANNYSYKDDYYNICFVEISKVLSMNTREASNIPFILQKYFDHSLSNYQSFTS